MSSLTKPGSVVFESRCLHSLARGLGCTARQRGKYDRQVLMRGTPWAEVVRQVSTPDVASQQLSQQSSDAGIQQSRPIIEQLITAASQALPNQPPIPSEGLSTNPLSKGVFLPLDQLSDSALPKFEDVWSKVTSCLETSPSGAVQLIQRLQAENPDFVNVSEAGRRLAGLWAAIVQPFQVFDGTWFVSLLWIATFFFAAYVLLFTLPRV